MSKGWNGRAPAGRIAYVDGRYVAHAKAGVHVEDRALQLGDGVYEVVRLLPSDGDEQQYRVKSATEPHERVAKQSQLERAA